MSQGKSIKCNRIVRYAMNECNAMNCILCHSVYWFLCITTDVGERALVWDQSFCPSQSLDRGRCICIGSAMRGEYLSGSNLWEEENRRALSSKHRPRNKTHRAKRWVNTGRWMTSLHSLSPSHSLLSFFHSAPQLPAVPLSFLLCYLAVHLILSIFLSPSLFLSHSHSNTLFFISFYYFTVRPLFVFTS